MSVENDYPVGDGVPGCEHCSGRGVVPVPFEPGVIRVESTRLCVCVLARDVRANVERGWPGLMGYESKASKLGEFINRNVWLTMPGSTFRQQFKYVAVRQGPSWGFRVHSDADLMSAWLTNIKDVHDGDVIQHRNEHTVDRNVNLELLVIPPKLLIIMLGVKSARNSAMPEVLLETIQMRLYRGIPTWVVDQPTYPFRDGEPPHLAWSHAAEEILAGWKRLKYRPTADTPTPKPPKPVASTVAKKAAPPPPVEDAEEETDEEEGEDFSLGAHAPGAAGGGTVSLLDMNADDEVDPRRKYQQAQKAKQKERMKYRGSK